MPLTLIFLSLLFPTRKSITNRKIITLEVWFECGSGELLTLSSSELGDNWVNFHKFMHGQSLLMFFDTYPSGWTGQFHVDYIELP